MQLRAAALRSRTSTRMAGVGRVCDKHMDMATLAIPSGDTIVEEAPTDDEADEELVMEEIMHCRIRKILPRSSVLSFTSGDGTTVNEHLRDVRSSITATERDRQFQILEDQAKACQRSGPLKFAIKSSQSSLLGLFSS